MSATPSPDALDRAEPEPDAGSIGPADSRRSGLALRAEGAQRPGPAPSGPPRRWIEYLALETRRATAVYWGAVGLVAAALFVPRLLPMADYPQHLGMAAIARRLTDSASPLHAGFELDYFTYNGLFHWLTAALGRALPVELAGRLVVSLAIVGLAAGALVLLRTLERPPAYAALLVPGLFSLALSWGFVNHALGVALGTFALVAVARAAQRPSVAAFVITAGLGLVIAFAHVLAMLLLCALATALALELAWRTAGATGATARRRALGALGRAAAALAPLGAGALHCVAVYRHQYRWDPGSYQDPVLEGTMPPLWKKLALFPTNVNGVHADFTDAVLAGGAVALLVAIAWRARRDRRAGIAPAGSRAPVLPLLVAGALYFAVPTVWIGTHVIYPRLAQLVLLTAIVAAPRVASPARFERLALALAVVAGVNLCAHAWAFARETDAASRVVDRLPPGRNVTAVVHDTGTFSFRTHSLLHLAAYYVARNEGEYAFNFARYASLPLGFRAGSQPAWPLRGWEFAPLDYDPRCGYARYYDVVLVVAPVGQEDASEAAIRRLVFREDAERPRLLAREGRFWGFDTAGLPANANP